MSLKQFFIGAAFWQPPVLANYELPKPPSLVYPTNFLSEDVVTTHALFGVRPAITHPFNNRNVEKAVINLFQLNKSVTLQFWNGLHSCSEALVVGGEVTPYIVKYDNCNEQPLTEFNGGQFAAVHVLEGLPGLDPLAELAEMHFGFYDLRRARTTRDSPDHPLRDTLPASRRVHKGTPDEGVAIVTAYRTPDPRLLPISPQVSPACRALVGGGRACLSDLAAAARVVYMTVLDCREGFSHNVWATYHPEDNNLSLQLIDAESCLSTSYFPGQKQINFFDHPTVVAAGFYYQPATPFYYNAWWRDSLLDDMRDLLRDKLMPLATRAWLEKGIERRIIDLLQYGDTNPIAITAARIRYLILQHGVREGYSILYNYDSLNVRIRLYVTKTIENVQKKWPGITKFPLSKKKYAKIHRLFFGELKKLLSYHGVEGFAV